MTEVPSTNAPAEENVFIEDVLAKYKENEREIKRERKFWQVEREKETRYKKKLEEWLAREAAKQKNKLREDERVQQRAKDRTALIFRDVEYDEAEEKRKRKADVKAYMRNIEDRKRIREKEAEDDALDKKKENEELAELERKRVELERQREVQRRRDEEIKERMKLKKFIEMQEEMERKQQENDQQAALLKLIADQRAEKEAREDALRNRTRFQPRTEMPSKEPEKRWKHEHVDPREVLPERRRLPSSSSSSRSSLSPVSSQSIDSATKRANQEKSENIRAKIMEVTKSLFAKLPKNREEVFASDIDWDELSSHNVIEKVARPWVAAKIKEYLGVEEMAMISLVLGQLNARVAPETMLSKIEGILDEVSEQFVVKLW